jgi:single-strand DNA-binding protein
VKSITIAGKLGRDAELKYVGPKSEPVLGFSVAVDDRSGKEKSTLWFDCSLWGKRGEALCPHLTKGSAVTVSGDFTVRKYQKDGQERTAFGVRVNDVTLQGGKRDEGGGQKREAAPVDAGDYGEDSPF